jgi:uncharacterized membrane protein YgaE (UPF0421/DUF939 family)
MVDFIVGILIALFVGSVVYSVYKGQKLEATLKELKEAIEKEFKK